MIADVVVRSWDLRTWSFGELLIAIIVVAACVAIVYVALNYFGIQIPEWAKRIFWIIVVAFVAILAIRLVLGM